MGLFTSYPSPSTLKSASESGADTNFGLNLSSAHLKVLYSATKDNKGLLAELFPNSHMKDFLAQKSAVALSKSLVAGIRARNFRKQETMAQEVKQEYIDSDFVTDSGVDLGPTYCETNPTRPSCLNNGRSRLNNSVEFGTNGISAGGGGQAFDFGSDVADGGDISDTDQNTSQKGKIDNLNNLFDTAAGDKGSNDFSPKICESTKDCLFRGLDLKISQCF